MQTAASAACLGVACAGHPPIASCWSASCAACTRHHQRGPLFAPVCHPGVHAPLCMRVLLETPPLGPALGPACHSGVQAPLCHGMQLGPAHALGPALAPAYQSGVHAPLCMRVLLESPSPPYFLAHATHTRGTAVLTGADARYSNAANTAETMHQQLSAFAATGGPLTLESFYESCLNAVRIFNEAAEEHWHKMFVLQAVSQPQHDAQSLCVLLQMACISDAEDADFAACILEAEESVVAQLAVIVHKHGSDHFSVECNQFGVVDCLYGMQMHLLLKACGLLCAQQFAYLASQGQSVESKSEFFPNTLASCGNELPVSVHKVAQILWKWYTDSSHMYMEPLPQQIRQQRMLRKRKQEQMVVDLVLNIDDMAASIHNKLCAFVKTSKTELKTENLLEIKFFERVLHSAAEIMNQEAGEYWRKFFRFTVTSVPASESENGDLDYIAFFLQIACTGSVSEQQNTSLRSERPETVVARLKLKIHKQKKYDFKCGGVSCSFYVEIKIGVTVICLRHMHLGSLLRACALLATQQFAYFGSKGQEVGFEGVAVSTGSKKIYEKLFHRIGVAIDESEYHVQDDYDCSAYMHAHSILHNRREKAPQSIKNVASMLMHALQNSGLLFYAPLPTQIRR